ncbi:hypothetical protein CCP3SC5AM1_400025 [Gammaproteobacteria bacterium]
MSSINSSLTFNHFNGGNVTFSAKSIGTNTSGNSTAASQNAGLKSESESESSSFEVASNTKSFAGQTDSKAESSESSANDQASNDQNAESAESSEKSSNNEQTSEASSGQNSNSTNSTGANQTNATSQVAANGSANENPASSTLVKELSSGTSPRTAAFMAAKTVQTQTVVKNTQTVPVTPANQIIGKLATSPAGQVQTIDAQVKAQATTQAAPTTLPGQSAPTLAKVSTGESTGSSPSSNLQGNNPAGQSLVAALASGASPELALSTMSQVTTANAALIAAQTVPVSPPNQVAAALSGGGNTAATLEAAGINVNDATGQSLAVALASGVSPEVALATAQETATVQKNLATAQAVPMSPANQTVALLASGADVASVLGSVGGSDAQAVAGPALVAALAAGASPEAALASMNAATTANATLAESQAVPVTSSNKVAGVLANGGNVAAALQVAGITLQGDNAAGHSLVAALATGASPEAAMAAAAETIAAQNSLANAQSVPMSPANQATSLLANGGDISIALQAMGLNPQEVDTAKQSLVTALADGTSPEQALSTALETVKIDNKLSQMRTVPVSPANQVASVLTSGGNVTAAFQAVGINSGGNDVAGQALVTALASGASAEEAISKAAETANTQTAVTIAQTVPISQSDKFIATLADGTHPITNAELQEKNAAFLAALVAGASPEEALLAVSQAEEALTALTKAQSVQVSPTNQLIESLSNSKINP